MIVNLQKKTVKFIYFFNFQPLWNAKEPDRDLAVAAQPNLDYLAPEFGRNKGVGSVQETNVSISPSVDLYSLGCLIVSLFNEGKPPVSYDDDFEMFYKRVGMVRVVFMFKVEKGG